MKSIAEDKYKMNYNKIDSYLPKDKDFQDRLRNLEAKMFKIATIQNTGGLQAQKTK